MVKADVYVPTIDQLARMAPELALWTEMAARAFGTYSGINEAIKKVRDKDGPVAHHASEIRQQMIMMALIRSFAIMDRSSAVSFQAVYRFVESAGALPQIAQRYADSEPRSDVRTAMPTCENAKNKFLDTYRSVDFQSFKRIQSFRNSGIAHISWPDAVKAKVTYSDVERLVRGCCEMAGQLTLMVSGKNDWPAEHIEESHRTAYRFWVSAIAAESDGRLDTGELFDHAASGNPAPKEKAR